MQTHVLRVVSRTAIHLQPGRNIACGNVCAGEAQVKESVDELAARRRFNAQIAPHMTMLQARARQLCRSNYDPDDLVQDTLLRAFRAGSQLHDTMRTRAWLLTILTNAFIDAVRRRRRRPDTIPLLAGDEMPASAPDEPATWHNIEMKDLRAAVERLSADVRETYRMYALEGRNHAAIAQVQGVAISTVATRLFRARKQLRVMLTAAGPREGSR